jgi:hypothetical protein
MTDRRTPNTSFFFQTIEQPGDKLNPQALHDDGEHLL